MFLLLSEGKEEWIVEQFERWFPSRYMGKAGRCHNGSVSLEDS